jgi:hypothetical protein
VRNWCSLSLSLSLSLCVHGLGFLQPFLFQ